MTGKVRNFCHRRPAEEMSFQPRVEDKLTAGQKMRTRQTYNYDTNYWYGKRSKWI